MATLTFSELASEQIAELPRDGNLLRAVWRHLERAADDPDQFTEKPPPFPHRQDRRLCHFRAYDTAGDVWAFSALMADTEDGLIVTVFDFNRAGEYSGFDNYPPFEEES